MKKNLGSLTFIGLVLIWYVVYLTTHGVSLRDVKFYYLLIPYFIVTRLFIKSFFGILILKTKRGEPTEKRSIKEAILGFFADVKENPKMFVPVVQEYSILPNDIYKALYILYMIVAVVIVFFVFLFGSKTMAMFHVKNITSFFMGGSMLLIADLVLGRVLMGISCIWFVFKSVDAINDNALGKTTNYVLQFITVILLILPGFRNLAFMLMLNKEG